MDKDIIRDLEMYIPPKGDYLASEIVHEMIGVIARARTEIELRDAKIKELEAEILFTNTVANDYSESIHIQKAKIKELEKDIAMYKQLWVDKCVFG